MAKVITVLWFVLFTAACGGFKDEPGGINAGDCPLDRDIGRNVGLSFALGEEKETIEFTVKAEADVDVDNIYVVMVRDSDPQFDVPAMGDYRPEYITETYGIEVDKALCSTGTFYESFENFLKVTDGVGTNNDINAVDDPDGLCGKLANLKSYKSPQVISVMFMTLEPPADLGSESDIDITDQEDVRKFLSLNMRDSRYFDLAQLYYIGEDVGDYSDDWAEATSYTGGRWFNLGASYELMMDEVVAHARRGLQRVFSLDEFALTYTSGDLTVKVNDTQLIQDQQFVVSDKGQVRILHHVELAEGDKVAITLSVFQGDDPVDLPADDVDEDGGFSPEDC